VRQYRWIDGPSSVRRIGNQEVRVERGEVIELDTDQLDSLVNRGHTFELVDEPAWFDEPEDVTETTDADAEIGDEEEPLQVDDLDEPPSAADENTESGWANWRSS
jgi:hypothetical protein